VRIVVAQKDKVLKVLNTALRFKPAGGNDDKGATAAPRESAKSSALQAPRGGSAGGRIWVPDASGTPKAIPVRLGLSDGTMTEIISDDIAEGAEVIVGTATTAKSAAIPPGPRFP
jgi:HlyD family secretion protein